MIKTCEICKNKFKTFNSWLKDGGKYCSIKCYGVSKIGKSSWNKGKKWTKETKEKMSKASKGKKKSLEHIKNMGKALTGLMAGEKHWNWQGGLSFEPYTTDWTNTLRRAIRERDKYICQVCGKEQGDSAFSVHHIDYDKNNCNPTNLITLCKGCHTKTNYKRDYWLNYFKELGVKI